MYLEGAFHFLPYTLSSWYGNITLNLLHRKHYKVILIKIKSKSTSVIRKKIQIILSFTVFKLTFLNIF